MKMSTLHKALEDMISGLDKFDLDDDLDVRLNCDWPITDIDLDIVTIDGIDIVNIRTYYED